MKSLVPVFAAAMVPFAIIALIVVGSGVGLVQWRPPEIWSADFGTPNSDNGINAVSADASGLYATGFVGYTPPYKQNVTPTQLFVSRYDLNGHHVWTQPFGSPSLSQTNGLGSGQGGVYFAGTLNGTSTFVKKYDLTGNLVWSNAIGSGLTTAVAISVATADVYVGYFQGANSFLRDYDFNGNVLWTDVLGNYTGSLSLYSSPGGAYVLNAETSNTLLRKYDTGGSLVWSRLCPCGAYGANGISGDSTGIYVLGLAPSQGNALIARYASNGDLSWTTQFGAPDHSNVSHFQISAGSSGAYLTLTTGAGHSFLMNYDTSGNRNWSFEIPARGSTLSPWIPLSVGGNSLFVGGSLGKSGGTLDAYLGDFGQSSSLIFFGLNPPLSFATIGILVAIVATSIFFFRRLRRGENRPPRIGSAQRTIPAKD